MRKRAITLALLSLTAVTCLAVGAGCAGTVAPPADDYDGSYKTLMPSACDSFVTIDGKLDDEIWQNKQWFETRLSEDTEQKDVHVRMTTHMTEKGVYLGAVAYDSNIRYDGTYNTRSNSYFTFYIIKDEAGSHLDKKTLRADGRSVYSLDSVFTGEACTVVKGEVNSGKTEALTAEIYFTWNSLGMEQPENPDEVKIGMNVAYLKVSGTGATVSTRSLRVNPFGTGTPDNYFRFSSAGYLDADKEGACFGDSAIGVSKFGRWDSEGFAVNQAQSDAYTTVYDGKVTTVDGSVNVGYLKSGRADSFVFEANVVPLSYNSKYATETSVDGFAGLNIEIPGGKHFVLALNMREIAENTNGVMNFKKISPILIYQDYYYGTWETNTVSFPENGDFNGAPGVKLCFVKYGYNYYAYVNDTLVWSGRESRGAGDVFLAFYAQRSYASFENVRWTNFDSGENDISEVFSSLGTCLLNVETEGEGEASMRTIAVKEGESAALTVSSYQGSKLSKILINGNDKLSELTSAGYGKNTVYTLSDIRASMDIEVVFERYTGTEVSGKISVGEANEDLSATEIYAVGEDNIVLYFDTAVDEAGNYSVTLPEGTYKQLFIRGAHYENVFTEFADGAPLTVGSTALTGKNFTLTGIAFSETDNRNDNFTVDGAWTLVGDNCYDVSANNAANAFSANYFRNSSSQSFAVSFKAKAQAGAQIGVMMKGSYNKNDNYRLLVDFYAKGNYAIELFGWHDTARPVNGIGGTVGAFRNDKMVYPDNDEYEITVVKTESALLLFVNGVKVGNWSGVVYDYNGAAFDLNAFTVENVGLAIRGRAGAQFSNYSYTAREEDILGIISVDVDLSAFNASFGKLETTGIEKRNGRDIAFTGSDVTLKITPAAGQFVKATANGLALSGTIDGAGNLVYKLNVAEATTFDFTSAAAYEVSGSVTLPAKGASLSVKDETSGAVYDCGKLADSGYSVSLPDGNYTLRFDIGTSCGFIHAVEVAGGNVTVPAIDLDAAYGKNIKTSSFVGKQTTKWWQTADEYMLVSQSPIADANISYNLEMGKGTNFVISATVKPSAAADSAGRRARVGIALIDGAPNTRECLLFVDALSSGSIRAYLYGIHEAGGWLDGLGTATTWDKTSFEFTAVRKDDALYLYINGALLKSWSAQTVTAANHGERTVAFAVKGEYTVTFADAFFSTDAEDIASVLGHQVSGEVSGAQSGTLTVHNLTTQETATAGVANGVYSLFLKAGNYNFYFDGEGKEGVADHVTVDGDKAVNIGNLVATSKFGGTKVTTRWRKSAENAYTLTTQSTVADGNISYNLEMGTGTDFVISATITPSLAADTGNRRARVGIALIDGTPQTKECLLFVDALSTGYIKAYLYGISSNAGGWIDGTGTQTMWDNSSFALTVARKDNALYLYINGTLLKSWSAATVTAANQGERTAAFAVKGEYTVTFADTSFSTDAEDIASVLGYQVTGTVSGATGGTVTATDLTGGATASATVAGGSYSVFLKKGTYRFYFAGTDKEGVRDSVTVSGDKAVNFEALTHKPLKTSSFGTVQATTKWTYAENGYTLTTQSAVADGNISYNLEMGKGTDFVVSAKITPSATADGSGRRARVGIALIDGTPQTKECLMFVDAKNDGTIKSYLYGINNAGGWIDGNGPSTTWDNTSFVLTVVRKDNALHVYINGALLKTWTAATVTAANQGERTAAFAIKGEYTVNFSEYSFSTDAAEIDAILNP